MFMTTMLLVPYIIYFYLRLIPNFNYGRVGGGDPNDPKNTQIDIWGGKNSIKTD